MEPENVKKRYQVFISSTYKDLKEERKEVIKTLMDLEYIPAGMELFPAVDEEQFNYIKKVIDDCDYYILIIAGRYGSTTLEGISYTEKEYDYALKKGIPIIGLLQDNSGEDHVAKNDVDATLSEKLKTFKERVQTQRMTKAWSKISDISRIVSASLKKVTQDSPGVGWVRGSDVFQDKVIKAENKKLRMELDIAINTTKKKLRNISKLVFYEMEKNIDLVERANKYNVMEGKVAILEHVVLDIWKMNNKSIAEISAERYLGFNKYQELIVLIKNHSEVIRKGGLNAVVHAKIMDDEIPILLKMLGDSKKHNTFNFEMNA